MNEITLFASNNAADPDNATATQGKASFNVLKIRPYEEEESDRDRNAEGALDTKISVRTLYEIEFLPFYVKNEILTNQQSMNDLSVLKKMMRQPYLVLKSTDLPPYGDGGNFDADYPMPVRVVWTGDKSESNNAEQGIIEFQMTVENYFSNDRTQPTPVTTEDSY